MASITLHNLTVSYRRHPAVHHISGRFEAGSLTAITGPNGGGKSTLMRTIAGLLPADEGHVQINEGKSCPMAYLPQSAELQRDFPLSVLELVCSGFWQHTGALRTITPAMRERAIAALSDVGLEHCAKRDIAGLSSGQFQRVLFARLLVQDAPVILLDEPFTAIDAETTSHLLDIIRRWHGEKRTVICILHDMQQIYDYFPECLLLARECIAWGNTQEVLTPANLPYLRFFRDHAESPAEICKQAS